MKKTGSALVLLIVLGACDSYNLPLPGDFSSPAVVYSLNGGSWTGTFPSVQSILTAIHAAGPYMPGDTVTIRVAGTVGYNPLTDTSPNGMIDISGTGYPPELVIEGGSPGGNAERRRIGQAGALYFLR